MFIHQNRQSQQKGSDLVREETFASRSLQTWEERGLESTDGRRTLSQGGPHLLLRPRGRGENGEMCVSLRRQQKAEMFSSEDLLVFREAAGEVTAGRWGSAGQEELGPEQVGAFWKKRATQWLWENSQPRVRGWGGGGV